MDVLHIEQLLYYWRYSLCGLELREKSNWRAMAPDKHQRHSLIEHCVRTASPSIYRYLVHNCTQQQNSPSWWLYCTPNDGFAVNTASFYKNKVLRHDLWAAAVHTIYVYLHIAVSFRACWYTATSLLQGRKDQQQQKLSVKISAKINHK